MRPHLVCRCFLWLVGPDECWGRVKCICNICDCGGHRCPVHDRHIARATKFQGMSEAQAEYVRKEAVQPARAVKRQERHVQGGKFYSDTEARAQYVEHVVVPPAKREAIPYRPSAIKFQGQSENHAQYTEKEARAERATVTRAQDNLRVRVCGGVIVCTSLMDSRVLIPCLGQVGQGRFDAVTTNANDFRGEMAPRSMPYKPANAVVAGGKFYGTTENHAKFVEFPVSHTAACVAL